MWLRKKILPSVTFATSVWEKDWKLVLQKEDYLRQKQIGHHLYPFTKRMLIVNNVQEKEEVKKYAEKMRRDEVLTDVYMAEGHAGEVLRFFNLSKADFKAADSRENYQVENSWVYYNALAPLSAIYHASTDYLLYHTGDVWLPREVGWIEKAIRMMEKNPLYKVANLTWNEKYDEAKKESYKKRRGFYIAEEGFSDQLFLVKLEDFRKPIYGEIREDSNHYPRGDVFEKRVFSYMKNRGWERLTYAKGSYYHECFEKLRP